MKRTLAILLVLAILASVMAGCSGEPTAQPTSGDHTEAVGNETQAESTKKPFEGEQVVVYGRFMEGDLKWLSDTVWPEFEEKYGAQVIFKEFADAGDVPALLEMEKDSGVTVIFQTTDAVAPLLVDAGLVAPVSEYDVDGSYTSLFTDVSIKECTMDGVQYFTPFNQVCYATMYIKDPVADAVANWSSMKDEINDSLKQFNGYGLPDGYTLEADVNEWDNYDIAAAGYYWANTEYYGVTAPRIAHRAKRYDGTMTEITSKAYQMGATQEDIMTFNTTAVADMFAWENYYAEAGIYAPEMWTEGWSGGNVYQAMADGNCFLAFMHINDAMTVHGLGTESSPGYLADPDQMGMALSPLGTSLEIVDGAPARTGIKATTSFVWHWGVTASTPNKELAGELIKWTMTGKEDYVTHWQVAGQDVPLKDFAADPGKYLTEQWMIDVYKVMGEQMQYALTVPKTANWLALGTVYLDAWYDIVVDQNNDDIPGLLDEVYAAKAAEALD